MPIINPSKNKSIYQTQGDLGDTQPAGFIYNNDTSLKKIYHFTLILTALLIGIVSFSSLWGFQSGRQLKYIRGTLTVRLYLEQQYDLALEELESGDVTLAVQRLRYIRDTDPTFPNITDTIGKAENAVFEVGIEGINNNQPSPTPTKDPRPNQELYDTACSQLEAKQWAEALESIGALRNNDPEYQAVKVDGMIYTALRNRGVDKILNTGELEGGLYDFSLAEQFGPLDRDAEIYRVWARLYLQGNGFWMAYPEIALGYYAQVAAAAPGLHDLSGMSAFYRYWRSLIQYADQLASEGKWCEAYQYYRQAADARADGDVEMQAIHAQNKCFALTPPATKPKPTNTEPPATYTPIPPTETTVPPTDTQEAPPSQDTPTIPLN